MSRRVIDLADHSFGTATEALGRGRYRVEWDEPTPFQDTARVPIPSQFFDWAAPPALFASHQDRSGQ
jgi:hypothetical protein